MALTIATVSGADTVFGNKKVKVRDITFDSSYPTGGEALVPGDVGLNVIDQVLPQGPAGNSSGAASTLSVDVRYDHTNSKLQAFETAGTVDTAHKEVTAATDLTNYRVRCTFIGW